MKQQKKLPLFDIRIDSIYRDTIILKGVPSEAPSVMLSGTVALSVKEPIHVRKIMLSFYGTLIHNNLSKLVYCFNWSPIDLHSPISSSFTQQHSFTTGTLSKTNSSLSLNQHSRSSSHTSLTNVPQLPRTKSTSSIFFSDSVLQPGNYEFPFQTILDGSIPETIFDHSYGSLVYRIQCTIERGRFSNPIITRKLVNIVRTLSSDNQDLSESSALDNTWPNKVDYSISLPSKAIAIGSTCLISIMMQPLAKGLKLGAIKIKLNQYATFSTLNGNYNDEKNITTKHIPRITTVDNIDIWSDDAPIDENGVFYSTNHMTLSTDRWEINTSLIIPPSLETITQDLDIENICKVRHKLKFSIALLNKDGHTSELRATLPISLFISPFVPIKIKPIDYYIDHFQNHSYDDASIHVNKEDILFSQNDSSVDINGDTQKLMAPPNYNDRFYDRVVGSDNNPLPIPVSAPISTIHSHTSSSSLSNSNTATLSSNIPSLPPIIQSIPLDSSAFNNTLTSTTQSLSSHPTSPLISKRTRSAYFSIPTDDDDDDNEPLDPFNTSPNKSNHDNNNSIIYGPSFKTGTKLSIPNNNSNTNLPPNNMIMTPGTLSPVQHLSRATSFIGDSGFSLGGLTLKNGNGNNSINNNNGKINNTPTVPPSYESAISQVASVGDLTPVYERTGSGYFNSKDVGGGLHLLDSRLQRVKDNVDKENENPVEQRLERRKVGFLLGSINSSPSISRNISSNSLIGLNEENIKMPKAAHFSEL